jgi:hypothetical protein
MKNPISDPILMLPLTAVPFSGVNAYLSLGDDLQILFTPFDQGERSTIKGKYK